MAGTCNIAGRDIDLLNQIAPDISGLDAAHKACANRTSAIPIWGFIKLVGADMARRSYAGRVLALRKLRDESPAMHKAVLMHWQWLNEHDCVCPDVIALKDRPKRERVRN